MIPYHEAVNNLPPTLHTRLSGQISDAVESGVTPALSLAVFQQGRLRLNAAWGWVDPETQQHTSHAGTLFDLASVTKLFTTVAFLSLVSEGRVDLHSPIVTVLPEFAEGGPRRVQGVMNPHTRQLEAPDPAFSGQMIDPESISFWHLLTHCSGLAPWRDIYDLAGPVPPAPQEQDALSPAQRWRAGLPALFQAPFVGAPGQIVRYSDLGLLLLAEASARLHGADLAETITSRSIQPAQLENVLFNPLRSGGIALTEIAPTEYDAGWRKRRVWGEVHDENACGLGGIAGHAGLFAPALSVAQFGEAWLHHASEIFHVDPELARQATLEQASSDGSRRGLGFVLRAAENSFAGEAFSLKSYGHTGFTGTSLLIEPNAEVVVALLTNSVYGGRLNPGTHALRRAVHTTLAEIIER